MHIKIAKDDFQDVMKKLAGIYGEKKYNSVLANYIYEAVKDLTKNEVMNIVDYFAQHNTFAPKPSDFTAQARLVIKRRDDYGKPENQETGDVKCLDCYDTGYVPVTDKETQYDTFCRCPCKRGEVDRPRIALLIHHTKKYVNKRKFDHLWFVPSRERPFEIIKEEWKELLDMAGDFWEHKREEWKEKRK